MHRYPLQRESKFEWNDPSSILAFKNEMMEKVRSSNAQYVPIHRRDLFDLLLMVEYVKGTMNGDDHE